jgi:hypothetical protein
MLREASPRSTRKRFLAISSPRPAPRLPVLTAGAASSITRYPFFPSKKTQDLIYHHLGPLFPALLLCLSPTHSPHLSPPRVANRRFQQNIPRTQTVNTREMPAVRHTTHYLSQRNLTGQQQQKKATTIRSGLKTPCFDFLPCSSLFYACTWSVAGRGVGWDRRRAVYRSLHAQVEEQRFSRWARE